jgi:hypothetical protein
VLRAWAGRAHASSRIPDPRPARLDLMPDWREALGEYLTARRPG